MGRIYRISRETFSLVLISIIRKDFSTRISKEFKQFSPHCHPFNRSWRALNKINGLISSYRRKMLNWTNHWLFHWLSGYTSVSLYNTEPAEKLPSLLNMEHLAVVYTSENSLFLGRHLTLFGSATVYTCTCTVVSNQRGSHLPINFFVNSNYDQTWAPWGATVVLVGHAHYIVHQCRANGQSKSIYLPSCLPGVKVKW